MDNSHLFKEEVFDFKGIIIKYSQYWILYILSISIALLYTNIFNRYSTPIYTTSTSIMVNSDKNGETSGSNAILKSLSIESKKNVLNEIEVLKSFSLIKKATFKFNHQVSYFVEKKIRTAELYNENPYFVYYDTAQKDVPCYKNFYIVILNEKGFNFKVANAKVFKYYKFSDTINYNGFKFQIIKNENLIRFHLGRTTYFYFENLYSQSLGNMSSLAVQLVGKDLSIVSITMTGTNQGKIVDFLNNLTQTYIQRNLDQKNQIASNTVRFIDNQLSEISDSLSFTENKLQSFRKNNQIMDISDKGNKLYSNFEDLQKEKAMYTVQLKYYDYLKKYINENTNLKNVMIPNAIGVNDPILNSLVMQLIKLDNDKGELLYNTKQKTSLTSGVEFRIESIKKSISETLNNLTKSTQIVIEDIDQRMSSLQTEIHALPQTEREFLGIERKFKLNDDIYTFLLEKRAEAAIARASNTSDIVIIDEATPLRVFQIYPKKSKNYSMAFFLGLFIPIFLVFLKFSLDDKIIEKKDIENISPYPIIGNVLHSNNPSRLIVANSPKSIVSESFRAIRTNLFFLSKNNDHVVFLITSSFSGEGKTFCGINLASIYAINNKKTVLLGFDLRKPAISKDFELYSDRGISTYLIERDPLSSIIQHTHVPNLDIISAGPLPPNPSELIDSAQTRKLISELKEIYDIIIIDTPPVGIVSDGFLLMNYSDVNIFVVRQNFTHKKMASAVMQELVNNKIDNVAVLVNDLSFDSNLFGYKYSYGYRYSFKYGYTYKGAYGGGYYTEEDFNTEKPLWKRVLGIS